MKFDVKFGEVHNLHDGMVKAIVERTITDLKDDTLEKIGRYAFCKCENLKSASFPSLKYIDHHAFDGCSNLTNIELSDGVTNINAGAFNQCKNLVLTKLPENLEFIQDAFSNCEKLAITHIPKTVRTIMHNAFYGCTSLTSVTFKGTPSVMGYSPFNNCTNLTTINVPWAEGEVANAPWGATNATINYNYKGE
jgi:hypothetical protein